MSSQVWEKRLRFFLPNEKSEKIRMVFKAELENSAENVG
jgi:hypothetical protein